MDIAVLFTKSIGFIYGHANNVFTCLPHYNIDLLVAI